MPRSVFLGRVVAPGEPVWLADDVELELAWLAWQADLCPGCGHPRTESFDPDNANRYVAHKLRCHACATADDARDALKDSLMARAGLYVHTTRE